jgi:primosomal protein N'
MRQLFLDVEIFRLDSDTQIKASNKKVLSLTPQAENIIGANTSESAKKGVIYLATEYALRHLNETIALCVVITPEAELAIPEFDIEERVYTHLRALSSIAEEIIIETHTPRLTLLEDLLHRNYRDFLIRTLRDRKLFRYPPYMGLAYIEISHKNPTIVDDIALKLTNKLGLTITNNDTTVLYDRAARMKRAGLTVDTLVLRSADIHTFLAPVRGEILRNRSVSLSIRGEKILD